MARSKAGKEGPALSLVRSCDRCGFKFGATKAKCPSCNFWHLKAHSSADTEPAKPADPNDDQTVLLSDVEGEEDLRYVLPKPLQWANRVFGGGIVTNSVNLYGGKNGAGKSTLSLQLAIALSLAPDPVWTPSHIPNSKEVLLVAAEEKGIAIKSRAKRLKLGDHMHLIRLHPVGSSADLSSIIMTRRPRAIIFDSLPAFVSDPAEAVDFCQTLKDYAMAIDCPMVVIDHVNKSDDFAGLESLQHKVDGCFIQYPVEDSRDNEMREINVTKNRFGPANFVMRVRMTETGIVYHESDQADDPALGGDDDDDDDE